MEIQVSVAFRKEKLIPDSVVLFVPALPSSTDFVFDLRSIMLLVLILLLCHCHGVGDTRLYRSLPTAHRL